MEIAIAVALAVFVTVCIFIWYIRLLHYRYQQEIKTLKELSQEKQKTTTTTQRSVIKGQIVEQLYPLLKTCEYVSSDMRFFGHPIDYVVFDGLSESRDSDSCFIKKVILIDVKTGNARLSREQMAIKSAVENGRVEWLTIRI